MLGQLRRRLFGIAPEETTVQKRGFSVTDDRARTQIEKIGQTFVEGYHLAITNPEPATLVAGLNEIDHEFQGFAYEGVGMGLALLDILTPWPSKHLVTFLHGPGKPHYYIIQVGVGWALARLKRPTDGWLKRLDPVVNWLALDGYGFHEGYFHWQQFIEKQETPKRLQGYAHRGFDLGLGRSMWFVKGADLEQIGATINAFPTNRQPDLWSGVGLASTYAGGADHYSLESLAYLSGAHHCYLAQGSVLAASTRLKAGNPVEHTAMACQVICNLTLDEAFQLFNETEKNLPTDGPEPAFDVWRQRIQAHFTHQRERV